MVLRGVGKIFIGIWFWWLCPCEFAAAQTHSQQKTTERLVNPSLVPPAEIATPQPLTLMTWNIWHGGKEDGEQVGPQRVIDVIRESGADIVAMQETYGSGELISQGLQYHFLPRGTNLSIHSRFPIIEDISVYEEFKCVGALIELPHRERIAFYCLWLPYRDDIWIRETRTAATAAQLLAACQPSAIELEKILAAIDERLRADQYDGITRVIAGDFNSMSHLDWTNVNQDQFHWAIDWPTSRLLTRAGYRDSYRETHPLVERNLDATWSPRFAEQEQDRIDFVYYRSQTWRASQARVIRDHAVRFPSDHAAVVATLVPQALPTADKAQSLNAVSYNIRRGWGLDQQTDLNRTAAVLQRLEADFVALQEVDLGVNRSGQVNQPHELGKRLGMHAAFGKFMDYDGGRYGMAILSRHPLRDCREVQLPAGHEPRIALAAEALLPDDQIVTIVNVHFDWVADDTFRFAQAQKVRDYLRELQTPYLLLGDFNDGPHSRTLELFREQAREGLKDPANRFTFPADSPREEIDFVFAGPAANWELGKSHVVDERHASDHRPVFTRWKLR